MRELWYKHTTLNQQCEQNKAHRLAFVGIVQKRCICFLPTRRTIFPTTPIVIIVVGIVSRWGMLVPTAVVFVEHIVAGGFTELVEVRGDVAN